MQLAQTSNQVRNAYLRCHKRDYDDGVHGACDIGIGFSGVTNALSDISKR